MNKKGCYFGHISISERSLNNFSHTIVELKIFWKVLRENLKLQANGDVRKTHFPSPRILFGATFNMAAARLGRLASKTTAFFLCDMQEKFRPSIRYFPEIITVAKRMVSSDSFDLM